MPNAPRSISLLSLWMLDDAVTVRPGGGRQGLARNGCHFQPAAAGCCVCCLLVCCLRARACCMEITLGVFIVEHKSHSRPVGSNL